MKTRIYQLDWMRVVAAFTVVLLHTAAPTLFLHEAGIDVQWWKGAVIASITHWAVPVFFMMSGALYLQKNERYAVILKKVQARLVLPLILAVLGYAVFDVFTKQKTFSLSEIFLRMTFDQPYDHLYFLVALLFLICLLPVWEKWKVSSQQIKNGVLLFFILLTLLWQDNRFIGTFWWKFIIYFLLGHFLFEKSLVMRLPLWMKTILVTMLLGSSLMILWMTWKLTTDGIPNNDGFWAFRYSSPLVLLQSVILFVLFVFSKLPNKELVKKLSNLSLGIYIIHPAILWAVNSLAISMSIILTAAITFSLSAVVTAGFYQLTDPLSSKLQTGVKE